MKKFLICLMSMLFIFIGCSKMDIQDTDINYDRTEIVFNSELITKSATIIDGTTLPSDWKFGIAASYVTGGYDETPAEYTQPAPDETDFFGGFKEVVKVDSLGKSFYRVSDGTYYWPRTGSMTFYALANGTTKPNATWDKTNAKLTLTGYNLGVIDDQKDLLYAKTVVTDVTESATKAVDINFNHTLAQIIFKFSKSTILNSTTVNVTSVKVSVPKTTADFDSSMDGYWTNLSGGADITVLSSSYTCTATPTVAGEAILVFPQTLPDNAIVTINYQTNVLGWTRNRTAVIKGSALKGKWEACHKYTYNIEVSTSEILFTSNVNNWTDDGNVIY